MKLPDSALHFRGRAFCLFVEFAFALLLLAGCMRREPRADFVLINAAEPDTLDAHLAVGQPDGRVVSTLFEGLTRLDPKTGDPIPSLAERWERSADGLIYTFFLRSNVVWSTGEPITAQDFVYSWRRALDPRTAGEYAGILYYIKNGEAFNTGVTNPATGQPFRAEDVGVTALDDHRLRVELAAPTAFFVDLTAFRTYVVVPRQAIEKYGDRWIKSPNLPSSGAYTLEFWRVNDRIRVRKNPRYWDAANTGLETIDFLPNDQPALCLNLFLSGQADFILDRRRVPPELLDELRRRPFTHTYDYLATTFIRVNVTKPPLSDPRVRRALSMAVDKRRLTERITRAGQVPATHITPPGLGAYQPPTGPGHDPAAARKLLAEAGFPDGRDFPPLQFHGASTQLGQQIGVECQEMWKRELGLKVELRLVEWKVYLNDQSKKNFDVSFSSWVGDYKDPNTFLDMWMSNNGNNRTGFNSPRYDELMRQANAEVDPTRRLTLLRDAETLLVRDELPLIPLYFEKGMMFYDATKFEGIYGNVLDEHPLNAIRRKEGSRSQGAGDRSQVPVAFSQLQ